MRNAAVADIKPTVKVYCTNTKCEPTVPSMNSNTLSEVMILPVESSNTERARLETKYTHRN